MKMISENLLKLAGKLDTIPEENFDMDWYRNVGFKSINDCGTVGCALGWAPFVDGLEPIESEYGLRDLDWRTYSERITGFSTESDEWYWCFSDEWQYVDNTPKGAAKRIRYLVNYGLPKNWEKQMFKREPYMFSEV